jgi:hypothetical protein
MKGVTNFLTFLGAVFGLGYYYYQYQAAKLDYERKAAETTRPPLESQNTAKAPPQQAPVQSTSVIGPISAASTSVTNSQPVHGQTPWLLPNGQVVQPVCCAFQPTQMVPLIQQQKK